MKKIASLIIITFLVCANINAQEYKASSQHYVVYSDSSLAEATSLSKTFDKLFDVFNSYFRFDAASLKVPLTVRYFSTKDAFNVYLKKTIAETKDDFVYLQYPSIEKSELLIFEKSNKEEFNISLAHQAFIQFIKSFVQEPPLWLREGFAVFFERSYVDASEQLVYTENQTWLETVKVLKTQAKLYNVMEMMTVSPAEAKSKLDVFYPEAWAFVSFLLNSEDKQYNRFLWDTVSKLAPQASLEQNQADVQKLLTTWYDPKVANADFLAYIDSQKTFAELITIGIKLYGDKNYDAASTAFVQASQKNPSNYIAFYYLGLIAYANTNYPAAKDNYIKALELGSDTAITNYALGINAYEAKSYDEAKAYLNKAILADPSKYKIKASEIIARIDAGQK